MEKLKTAGGENVSKVNVTSLLVQNGISITNFTSLKDALNKDEFIQTQANLIRKSKPEIKLTSNTAATSTTQPSQNIPTDDDLDEDDYLVPDPYLASVLNEDREVEIDNTVYKITEFGTYMYEPQKETVVNSLVDSLRNANFVLENNLISGEVPNGDGVNYVRPGVLRYQSRIDVEENIIDSEDQANTNGVTSPAPLYQII